MRNSQILTLIYIFFGLLLNGCALEQPPATLAGTKTKANAPIARDIRGAAITASQSKNPRKSIEFNAVLRDPLVRKDFNSLKAIAKYATVIPNNHRPKFTESTTKSLNQISNRIVKRLNDHYHLDAKEHETHVDIAKYRSNWSNY